MSHHDSAYDSLEHAEAVFDLNHVAGGEGYWYLASPYSKYPHGIEEAYREICRASAWLVNRGVKLYCPIAHTHPIAIHGDIDPYAHQIWLPLDEPFMHGAKGLIVCMMPTWRDSYGIGVEIETFKRLGKPIMYMPWAEAAKVYSGNQTAVNAREAFEAYDEYKRTHAEAAKEPEPATAPNESEPEAKPCCTKGCECQT